MGLFRPNFDKPGKGVDENAPQKRSFFRFFDVFWRKKGKLMKANLLYCLALIPAFLIIMILVGLVTSYILSVDTLRNMIRMIAEESAAALENIAPDFEQSMVIGLDVFGRVVLGFLFVSLWGAGPATAGVTYIWRNFAREEHAWIWSDFKDSFKENFKQSIAVFAIDIVAFVLFYMAIRVYGSMSGVMSLLQYVIWMVALIYTLMHFYLYPMMVTFRLSLKELFRNALIFAVGKLPSNLLVLAVLLLLHLGPVYFIIQFGGGYFAFLLAIVLVLEILIFLSFSGFLVNFNAYPKMKQYMMQEEEASAEE